MIDLSPRRKAPNQTGMSRKTLSAFTPVPRLRERYDG